MHYILPLCSQVSIFQQDENIPTPAELCSFLMHLPRSAELRYLVASSPSAHYSRFFISLFDLLNCRAISDSPPNAPFSSLRTQFQVYYVHFRARSSFGQNSHLFSAIFYPYVQYLHLIIHRSISFNFFRILF